MNGDTSVFGAQPERLDRLFRFGLEQPPAKKESPPPASVDMFVEKVGDWVDQYKLIDVLGEGGMGMVYLAEQEEPIRRRVALKVIKPGMDSARVIARFEAERQALALLDHPNIAHVFNAGTTEAGRPYFVMEYIQGIPITEHCNRHKLTIEERLDLFLRVSEAVQYAHQKGIIHRDIKPSNILVAFEAEHPTPMIIDFGVAKAISQPLTERTLVTEQGQFIGTAEYMSPEQAAPTTQDIDTRSDIYSLGVVLYELLTGELPFDPKAMREGGIDHIRHMIREEDPKTPSARLSTISRPESTKLAQLRRTDARTLGRQLHGDLDWITLKAMEKDPMRRYQTAHALAEDLQRHLNSEPVLAGPPSSLYRFQKLVRRNRAVFAGVAAVAAALVMGLTVSAVSLVRARQAREKEAALRRQVQAQAYASDMSVAQQALAANDLGRARRLLEAHRPAPGQLDLRGWEWRYLWQECRSDALGELCRYPNSAYSVAYSPSGDVLAVAGLEQEFVEIWDVPGRERIATLQHNEGHLVAFSPQGDLLATNAVKQIRLWRPDTRDLVAQLDLPGDARGLKFSPDGRRLACLSYPNAATVWDVDQWTIVRRIRGVPPRDPYLGSLDFSPDGEALVIGDANRRLQVVDLASGNTNFDIPDAHPEPISFVAWSPDGSVIASGSAYLGGAIRLWDAASGEPLGTLEGHTSWICELVFSADGRRLYSASADQTIRIWDMGQQRCLATLRGSTDEVYGLALSPDDATLASASKDGGVAFWSAHPRPEEESPRLIELGKPAQPQPAFAPAGRVLAAPCAGTVTVLDPATSEVIEQIPALGADVRTVAYSADGALLASGSGRRGGRTRVWSRAERRLLLEFDDPNRPLHWWRFWADGRRLLSVSGQGKVTWWDTLTRQAVRTFTMGPCKSAAVSPDSRLLVVGAVRGVVRWINAETGELLATTTDAHRHELSGITFSEDGSRAASVAFDGTLAIWDPSSFQLIDSFKGHMLGAHAVAFSPDGRRLATGGGGGREVVKLWDVSTRRELLTLPGQGTQFNYVAFSPDGIWLAACNWQGELHLWRAPSWEEIEAAESRQSP
jgi:WD40 repeat protein/serine/threonine protein kinase